MARKFMFAGCICDTDTERESLEDVTPVQIRSWLEGCDEGEEIELEITSYGGSVTAGLAICNLLKQASAKGHKTTAHIIGIAASMASAVACACDRLVIDSNAFMMVHNPWTVAQGNANDMRKEADTLDKYRDALIAIYRSKFDCTDDEIKAMLDAETWIIGAEAETYKLRAEVNQTTEPLKVAASLKRGKITDKMPDTIKAIITAPEATEEKPMEKETTEEKPIPAETEEEKPTEETPNTENVTTEETPKEETPAEVEPEPEPTQAEPEEEKPVCKIIRHDNIPQAEVEKRVSGMQSKMQKRMDAMRAEYEGKIENLNLELKAKCDELTTAQAKVISLTTELENAKRELCDTTSALADKTKALATLNANVNTPASVKNWRTLKGQAFFDYVKKHPELTTNN